MLDRATLIDLIAKHGPCMRVVTAEVKGSGPREVGSAMIVWADGQAGTIGGGTLEFEATKTARQMLADGKHRKRSSHPLGPALGQCCGGAVTLVTERFDQETLDQMDRTVFARRVSGDAPMPFPMRRDVSDARAQGASIAPQLVDGWFIEPIAPSQKPLWIWGAGHVGRALVQVFTPLPGFDITWIDTEESRFPETIPDRVDPLIAVDPSQVVKHAPRDAHHLIVTFSHALDLNLCHQLLQHDFAFTGLIGSKTKWTRFQKRLRDLGHSNDQISRITCPIGDPSLGKHPQAIAIGVAAKLLKSGQEQTLGWKNFG